MFYFGSHALTSIAGHQQFSFEKKEQFLNNSAYCKTICSSFILIVTSRMVIKHCFQIQRVICFTPHEDDWIFFVDGLFCLQKSLFPFAHSLCHHWVCRGNAYNKLTIDLEELVIRDTSWNYLNLHFYVQLDSKKINKKQPWFQSLAVFG